jgi:uncharacterized protein (TIGR00290 family)
MAATPVPTVLSWSGGKDSALALDVLRTTPDVTVRALLTTVTRDYDRVSMHGVRRSLLHAQASSLGLPVHEVVIEARSSNEAYGAAMTQALADIRRTYPDVTKIAFGDLFLEDVRRYREERLAGTGFEGVFPLWGQPTVALARSFVDRGFEARLVCVDTEQLDASFAGRPFDRDMLRDLPPGADPCGERGEFHTFVSAGPGFSTRVSYDVGETVRRDERFVYTDLLPSASG